MERLLHEIGQQPEVMARLLREQKGRIESLAAAIRERGIAQVLIAARGSSDNAATYAKYLFGMANGLPVALAAPSMYTLYGQPPRLADTLVIGVSQSGMSPDIVAVIQDARQQGMLTVAITNDENSRLAQAAEQVIGLLAGEERSVAATKTYTAELMVLAMLSVALANDEARWQQLAALPEAVAATLSLAETIRGQVERYRYLDSCAVIGRGYNYATSFEAALKIKELTYTSANPYSSADFMHGPIAVVGSGYPVLLCAPSGAVLDDMRVMAATLRERGGEVVVISDDEELLALAHTPIRAAAGGGRVALAADGHRAGAAIRRFLGADQGARSAAAAWPAQGHRDALDGWVAWIRAVT